MACRREGTDVSPSDRELARHWREWANDTGREVVRCADLRAQGLGDTDMRTLLWFAFMAGWYARRTADVHMAFEVADTDKAKVRQAVHTAIAVLREVA